MRISNILFTFNIFYLKMTKKEEEDVVGNSIEI